MIWLRVQQTSFAESQTVNTLGSVEDTVICQTTTPHCLCAVKQSYITLKGMGMAELPLHFIHSNRLWAGFD